ncbi:hypothetical protein [Methylocystis heyeri]|uniref:Uncharacterized protein n=1 Tax=Methylocystis heyeri TaxID=391905 RepID=A0A6B8KCY8_9HYPH|nr:hypothetical protein [Methylocystis heyeri]QGM44895.1 hypothetical protein H2LOC_003885 [Methylocystis heyeri]
MKAKAVVAAIVLAMSANAAFAVSVTNTAKKGSLLVFPMINIDPAASADTIIEISNDQTTPVHVECYYVNEQKGRVNFDFELSAKATVSWDVLTQNGDQINPPPFPAYGDHPEFGNLYRGELVCFATNPGVTEQIAFNHLHGTASVLGVGSAIKYSPYSFWALASDAVSPEVDNTVMPTAGQILLDGGSSHYDACPLYNTTAFMPNGATLGRLSTGGNYLAVASCNQDLRQDYKVHTTKLLFTVWNSLEQSYTGSYFCADSVTFVPLIDNNAKLTNQTNFDYKTLGTPDAQFTVQGIPSTQCPTSVFGTTESSGLLAITAAYARIAGGNPALIGSNVHSAGSEPGYVYWDAASIVPTKKQH